LTVRLDDTTELAPSPCCECKHVVDHATGDGQPSPGDWTLCIRCGSLNVFDDNLMLRAPTLDEFLDAAKNSDVQRKRRAILAFNSKMGKDKTA